MLEPIDLLIEDERWNTLDLHSLAAQARRLAFDAVGLQGDFTISILACNDARIAGLNAQFRDKAKPTNVLSWPVWDLSPEIPGDVPEMPEFEDAEPELGDIAIAYETVMDEAASAGVDAGDHVVHLLLHAILHLLGYDHVNDADATRMEKIETIALASIGIADPY